MSILCMSETPNFMSSLGLLSKFQVMISNLWDKSRGLDGIGYMLEPLHQFGSGTVRQQEGYSVLI